MNKRKYYYITYRKFPSNSSTVFEINRVETQHPVLWQQEWNNQNKDEQIIVLWWSEITREIAKKIIPDIE